MRWVLIAGGSLDPGELRAFSAAESMTREVLQAELREWVEKWRRDNDYKEARCRRRIKEGSLQQREFGAPVEGDSP